MIERVQDRGAVCRVVWPAAFEEGPKLSRVRAFERFDRVDDEERPFGESLDVGERIADRGLPVQLADCEIVEDPRCDRSADVTVVGACSPERYTVLPGDELGAEQPAGSPVRQAV